MDYYYLIIIIVLTSMCSMFMVARFSIQLKHLYDKDYKPKNYINEAMLYIVGLFGGSLGLLLCYIFLPNIRKNDSLNSYRYLWISLLELAVHVTIVVLLFYYGIIRF